MMMIIEFDTWYSCWQ